ncbi:MAG: hypothetical protein ACI8W8_002399 [Rhodothermales bacterium]|jgi:hypothetical protein
MKILLPLFLTSLISLAATNIDESKVPPYTLPDPLVFADGSPVTAESWPRRRAEILALFEEHVYGKAPAAHLKQTFKVASIDTQALGGIATRKSVHIYPAGEGGPVLDMLLYLPNARKGPVPAFIGLNFDGNQATTPDPSVPLPSTWLRNNGKKGIVNNRATEKSRGVAASRWPYAEIVKRGYAIATICCGDIDPDFDDGFKNGVHGIFGKTPGPGEWGAIAGWAWGLSRGLDYFESDTDVNGKQVSVIGHSRLGKTALWAGAVDPRFAIVISNNSGCGGAALSRRRFGEKVGVINTRFTHWFCKNFQRYNDNEVELPVDQHMLVALAAPRPVFIASAKGDTWADPRGEYLSAKHASPVYKMLGVPGLPGDDMPAVDTSVIGTLAYHMRSGKHDIRPDDWQRYLDFADRHFE